MREAIALMKHLAPEARIKQYLADNPSGSYDGYRFLMSDKETTKEEFQKVAGNIRTTDVTTQEQENFGRKPIPVPSNRRKLSFKMPSSKPIQEEIDMAKKDNSGGKRGKERTPEAQRAYNWIVKNVTPGGDFPTRGEYVKATGDEKVSTSTYNNARMSYLRSIGDDKKMPKRAKPTKAPSHVVSYRIIHTIDGIKPKPEILDFFKKNFGAVVRSYLDLPEEETPIIEYVQLLDPDRLEIRQRL